MAYCQIKLAECTKNDVIEVVKRNITNLFEDVDDPFAEEILMDESPQLQMMQRLKAGGFMDFNQQRNNLVTMGESSADFFIENEGS